MGIFPSHTAAHNPFLRSIAQRQAAWHSFWPAETARRVFFVGSESVAAAAPGFSLPRQAPFALPFILPVIFPLNKANAPQTACFKHKTRRSFILARSAQQAPKQRLEATSCYFCAGSCYMCG
jgi:hypothetical protein